LQNLRSGSAHQKWERTTLRDKNSLEEKASRKELRKF